MEQQVISQKIKNQNDKKEKNKGQINIQNWITQQTEQGKMNQNQQNKSNQQLQEYLHQSIQQQQGFRLNLQQLQQNQMNPKNLESNFQEQKPQGQVLKSQNGIRDEEYNKKGVNKGNLNQIFQKNKIEFYNEENNYSSNNGQSDKNGTNNIIRQQNNNDINQRDNQLQKQHIKKQNQVGEPIQEGFEIRNIEENRKQQIQNQKNEQSQYMNQQQAVRSQIPQQSMSYEKNIQQKIQQEYQQQQLYLMQQNQNGFRSDNVQRDISEDMEQQSFSQDYNSSYEQKMKVDIIERQYQKSVTNKIYTFTRKFSDSEDYSDTEDDSSLESLQDVTQYDLYSQNKPKQKKNQINKQFPNKELDSLQKSFQNSIVYLINNQVGSSSQMQNQQQPSFSNLIQSNTLSNQNNMTNSNKQQLLVQNNTKNTEYKQQQIQKQSAALSQQQQQKLKYSNQLNFLSSSNLFSDNAADTFNSGGENLNENHKKTQKIDLIAHSNQNKQSQDLIDNYNSRNIENQLQSSGKKQAQIMKKIIQEGGVKFSKNIPDTHDYDEVKKLGAINKVDNNQKGIKFNFENKTHTKPKQMAEPLTVEDYNFGNDEEEDDIDDQCNYKNHNRDNDNSDNDEEDDYQNLKGDFEGRLKTEGNYLHDDGEDSEAAHKLYENTESELSEDVVRIPITTQNQNQNQYSSMSSASPKIQSNIYRQNEFNLHSQKQVTDFTKQKIQQNNNAFSISDNFNSTNNNSNKVLNMNNGAISTNSHTSNAYHSVNNQINNPLDSTTNKQVQSQESNTFNAQFVKQNIQRPNSSIQGTTSTNLTQTQKKKKQQIRLMETLKMTVNNTTMFSKQPQSLSQQRQQIKTISKSKENVSASMNCNTIQDLLKKKEVSKTTKKQPQSSEQFTNKRETPSQAKQRQTVYTSIGSMNNYSLIQDQQGSVDLAMSTHQAGNNNSQQNEFSSNLLPSKVVKRVGSQVIGSKIRNNRLKIDSGNPSCNIGSQTTANIHNHTNSKIEKSRERTSSASKKKTNSQKNNLVQNSTNYNNRSSNQIYQQTSQTSNNPQKSSKSSSQIEKFKKELVIDKGNIQKSDKTPIRNKTNEQSSTKNTGSKKNIMNNTNNQNQPSQQFLQYVKQQEKHSQINITQQNLQNSNHKYSSSPDNYAPTSNNNLNISQNLQQYQQQILMNNSQGQFPQNYQLHNNFIQSQQQQFSSQQQQIQQPLLLSQQLQSNLQGLSQQEIVQQSLLQQVIQQQGIHQQPFYQQWQNNMHSTDIPQQNAQQMQTFTQNNNHPQPHNQIQQLLQKAQQNLLKQSTVLANNQKNNTSLRQVSPNYILDEPDKNQITQNKLYQQAKSSLARCRNDEDTPKQILKNKKSSFGPNNFNKKSTLMTSFDKTSKDKGRLTVFGQNKLKTRIQTEPGDGDDSSLIFNSNRNNNSKPHISPQINSFLIQDNCNQKNEKNLNKANKSTTRTRNKQGDICKTLENECSRFESSTEKEQNNNLKALIQRQKKK